MLRYDLKACGLQYKTATNLGIFPKNSKKDIEKIAELLNINLKEKFVLINNPDSGKKGNIKHPFPTPISF